MRHHIRWIFEFLLRLLLPSSGRHRAADSADSRPATRHRDAPTTHTGRLPDAPARPMAAERVDGSTIQLRPISESLDGHGAAMVRPYVVAYEQQRERQQREQRQRQLRAEGRLRRRRRRTLSLAVHGIDIGPRVIHGLRVVA